MSSPPDAPNFPFAMASDVGVSRSENQDFGFAGPLPGTGEWTLLAVADGLGGHARGEWASERTIALLIEQLPALLADSEPPAAFDRAIAHANKTVFNEARDFGWPGSATTLVAALVREGRAWWVNVGDSRLYHLSGGRLKQVSHDHSVVAEQVRAGLLSADEASSHPHRNVVTRTVGFEPWVEPETGGPIALAAGDVLLLESDGLHGVVGEKSIRNALKTLPPAEAVEILVRLANQAGGPDNITVVIGQQQ